MRLPYPWSPADPNFYHLTIDLLNETGQKVDSVEKSCGFRTVETRNGMIYLNGQPFYLRGALDQDYYPETITTPPSIVFLEDQMRKVKSMGLNCLRLHIKLVDPCYYDVADRLGVFLWVDFPNWQQFSGGITDHLKQSLLAMLKRDHLHPPSGSGQSSTRTGEPIWWVMRTIVRGCMTCING